MQVLPTSKILQSLHASSQQDKHSEIGAWEDMSILSIINKCNSFFKYIIYRCVHYKSIVAIDYNTYKWIVFLLATLVHIHWLII